MSDYKCWGDEVHFRWYSGEEHTGIIRGWYFNEDNVLHWLVQTPWTERQFKNTRSPRICHVSEDKIVEG